jgi:SAM-dependent methyltransferase
MSSPMIWSIGRYESLGERIASIAAEVVDAADRRSPVRHTALVDLACGTGSAALAAAARGARVTAVDITADLIAIAIEKATASDLAITWLTADASATGLPDDSFDAVVSNMGTIFVEPTAQVAELERLLKAGGTLAFSSWAPNQANPFFTPIVEVLGPPPASPYAPDQWGDPKTITARLSGGFVDVSIENGMHTWEFASVDSAVNFVTNESPKHVTLFGQIDSAAREQLRAAFEAAMKAHSDDAGVRFDAPYVVVTARRR